MQSSLSVHMPQQSQNAPPVATIIVSHTLQFDWNVTSMHLNFLISQISKGFMKILHCFNDLLQGNYTYITSEYFLKKEYC